MSEPARIMITSVETDPPTAFGFRDVRITVVVINPSESTRLHLEALVGKEITL